MTNDTVEVSVLKITRARNDNKPNLVANARIKLNIFGVQQEIGGFSIWHGCDGVGITPLKINGEAMYRAEEKALWSKITNAIKSAYLIHKKNELSNSFSIKK